MKSLQLVPINLAELIDETLKRHEALAATKDVKLTRGSLEDGLISFVEPRLMERVLDHLLLNAIEHTGARGKVVISGKLKAAAVEIVVADSGKGVPDELREAVFTLDPKVVLPKNSRGGLSLYFCRKAVEVQGGNVVVVGPSGNNRFVVTLPEHKVSEDWSKDTLPRL